MGPPANPEETVFGKCICFSPVKKNAEHLSVGTTQPTFRIHGFSQPLVIIMFRAGGVTWLIESLPRVHEALGWINIA